MPPKITKADGAASGAMTNDAFLAACIKFAKDKITVDFEALATATGMSRGGAANKFRGIMRQFEQDGATWAGKGDDTAAKGKPKATAAGTKRKAGTKKEEVQGEENGAKDATVEAEDGTATGNGEVEPSKKKAKGKVAKAKPAAIAESDGEGDAPAQAAEKPKAKRGRKPKAAPVGGTGAGNGEVDKEVKGKAGKKAATGTDGASTAADGAKKGGKKNAPKGKKENVGEKTIKTETEEADDEAEKGDVSDDLE